MADTNPQKVLQKYFGYSDFRPGQREIVDSILAELDTVAILSTGGGKSICYQVPGLIFPGTTVVISPLISLMKDQVDQLIKRQIPATYINSSLTHEEQNKRFTLFTQGKFKFVYISPERLQTSRFVVACQKISISFLAIDEAHCISQWGHDFRPEYLEIAKFIQQLPTRPVIAAFTASATPTVRQEIQHFLQLKNPQVFLNSFRRENLAILIKKCVNTNQKELLLVRLLKKHAAQTGIIYCGTREQTEETVQLLHHFGWEAVFYHGGINAQQRSEIQDNFTHGKIKIVAATNAFGMGVDVNNIRFVIHLAIPQTVEGYYQEIGRGGRDRTPASCYFLYSEKDIALACEMCSSQKNQRKEAQLEIMLKFLKSRGCRMANILRYFGEVVNEKCEKCDNCGMNAFTFSSAEIQNIQKWKSHPTISSQLVTWLAVLEPQTKEAFLKIPGIGKGMMPLLQRTDSP